MTEFCEYVSPFGGVCMQLQAPQPQGLESELLRYCETHTMIVQRERERARRLRRLAPLTPTHQPQLQQLGGSVPADRTRIRHLHAGMRSRSEPYLQRSASRGSSRRLTVVDTNDESPSDDDVYGGPGPSAQWTRSISSPPRLQQDETQVGSLLHNDDDTPRASVVASSFPSPNEQRKRVRVKRIVIPPRFEVLDDREPAVPPKVWYVRLAERVAGEPGDPDDDEYIEVDASGAASAASRVPL